MNIEELERKELRKKQVMVAGLFLMAIALSMVFAYWMGAFGGFGPTRKFYVDYSFVGGVEKGTPVRYAGIKVGRVAGIEFLSEGDARIRLKVDVSKDVFSQMTADSKFYVNLAGLIGERYVEVVSGTGEKATHGQVFRGIDPPRIDQLISQSYGIFGDIRDFFNENKGDLKGFVTVLTDLFKNMNTLLATATPEQRRKFNQLLTNFAEMSEDLKHTMSSVKGGLQTIEANGAGKEAWANFSTLLKKGSKIDVDDIRRLMLEDGVKVNFSRTTVEKLSK